MRRLIARLERGAELVAALLFAAMFGAFLVQIVSRYVLNRPVGWSQEAALIAYLWVVFWACAFLAKERDHIAFDMLYQVARPGVRRAMAALTALLAVALLLAGLPGTIDFVSFMAIDRTWVLKIRFDYVFAVFLVFMVAAIARYFIRLWRLSRNDWETEL